MLQAQPLRAALLWLHIPLPFTYTRKPWGPFHTCIGLRRLAMVLNFNFGI